MNLRRKMHGVTLMELMIVVVIIGVLTAIAFPNYREFVARASRNEAKAALLQIAANQEKIYLQTSSFTTDLTQLGFTAPFKTESEKYQITILAPTPNSDFSATVTYLGGGSEVNKCQWFRLNASGLKESFPYTDCWTRTR